MRLAFAVAAAALVAAPGLAEPARFASAVEDLPLMAELEEEATAPFETPQGRIVRIEATGWVTPDAVIAFYDETLPALGWRRVEADVALAFARGGERLELKIDPPSSAGGTRVTFLLTPASAPAL